jgi:hypothetical protein
MSRASRPPSTHSLRAGEPPAEAEPEPPACGGCEHHANGLCSHPTWVDWPDWAPDDLACSLWKARSQWPSDPPQEAHQV